MLFLDDIHQLHVTGHIANRRQHVLMGGYLVTVKCHESPTVDAVSISAAVGRCRAAHSVGFVNVRKASSDRSDLLDASLDESRARVWRGARSVAECPSARNITESSRPHNHGSLTRDAALKGTHGHQCNERRLVVCRRDRVVMSERMRV